MTTDVSFLVVLRGYDRLAVDAAVRRAAEAIDSSDPALRAAARQELSDPAFRVTLRGYDRASVDAYFARIARELG